MRNDTEFSRTNKYVQGSIWHWNNTRDKTPGVQGGERPVLIISNNDHNYYSPSVNCVTVSRTDRESSGHVPVHITVDSYIQTEQIHTISKTELGDFMGVVTAPVLDNVKGLLTMQLDLEVDRYSAVLSETTAIRDALQARDGDWQLVKYIHDNVKRLNQRADQGFGVKEIEEEFVNLVLELHKCVEKLTTDIDKLKSTKPVAVIKAKPAFTPDKPVPKTKFRRYTEDERRMIEDLNVSIEDLAKYLKVDDLSKVNKIRRNRIYRKPKNTRTKTKAGGGR